jgi:hypothetical protein
MLMRRAEIFLSAIGMDDCREYASQPLAGVGVWRFDDRLWWTLRHNFSSACPAFGAKIDHPVSRLDHV